MNLQLRCQWLGGLVAVFLLIPGGAFAAANDLSTALSKGLFEEEANHNLGAAIQAYRNVIDHFDNDRKMAATAVFRLGECYRKQGSTNEATVQYQRILREFADQAPLVTLSRQNLASLSGAPGASLAPAANQSPEQASAPADAGEISRVKATINNSPDLINAPDQSGQTLLQTYAGRGDLAVVKLLLDSGAAVNGIRQPELTPLHYAAGNGHRAVVDLLLSRGAKPDVTTESGVTPLHIAVSKGYELVAKDLLDAGAPVNAQVNGDSSRRSDSLNYHFRAGQTALQLACEKGYHSLADLLIAKGADVNANNGAALNAAVRANDESLVRTLLEAHADPKAGGGIALGSAAGFGNLPILDLLLAHCVNPDLTNLLNIAVNQKRPEVVQKLIALKADPNAQPPNGTPVLFSALSDPEILATLLDGGANPNVRDNQSRSALEIALSANNEKALESLLGHGADPNSVNPRTGLTPLLAAVLNASAGKTAAVKLLLEHGAKVNAQAGDNHTALHSAVWTRNKELVAILLQNGANPNLRDDNGQTPLDIAKLGPADATTTGILDPLRQHGASDDLPRFDRIEVRRFPNYTPTVFLRSTNDLNRFSLLELLAVHYGFVSAQVSPKPSTSPPMYDGRYDGRSRTIHGALPFPNLDRIEIRRPKPDGKDWTRIPVPVRSILESGDCSRDVWLQWGDQVEIPEADHPLDEQWSGFSTGVLTNLQKCVKREVRLTVKGQTTDLALEIALPHPLGRGIPPPEGWTADFTYPAPQFCLAPALDSSGLMRTSSDLTHVKVTRHNQRTGESWEKTFDCSGSTPYPDLWLRDGDIIEVPDKP